MTKRSITGLIAAFVATIALAPSAQAECISTKCADTVSIEQARTRIQTECGCLREGQKHGKYVKCVRQLLKVADITALIPQKACRKLILKCEKQSVCGKPTAAVCCKLKKNGSATGKIVPNASRCGSGSVCGADLGLFSKFDACAGDGTCAGPLPPTTTTTTVTTLPTTSSTAGPTTTTTEAPTTTTSEPTTTTTESTTTTTDSTTTTTDSTTTTTESTTTTTESTTTTTESTTTTTESTTTTTLM